MKMGVMEMGVMEMGVMEMGTIETVYMFLKANSSFAADENIIYYCIGYHLRNKSFFVV